MKDIQQLIKKNSQEGRYEDIFPKTFTDAVKDKESGKSLIDILSGFNMYFLSYNGSRELTRLQVPMSIRKTGLWITYVLYDKTVVIEWYAGEAIDDNSWGDSSNWRVGSNMLVGDISISSDGYWVVNGVITTTKAQGEQGITPMLRVGSNNHLQVSYTNGSSWVDVSTNPVYTQFRINNNKLEQSVDLGQTWTVVSDYIASWFRFTGTTGSSQNVGKIQISRNNGVTWSDLSGEFTNSLHIKGYVATIATLPSSAVQGDIYGVGPTYDPSDTGHTNPIYQLYVKDSTGWVNNGKFTSIAAGVVQTTGTSTTKVMSQDAVSKELASLETNLNAIEQEQIQGGVYDVSSHNDGAVFESLSTLLGSANLSTLIPTSVRRGGMSIRFIQGSVPNSDNKYVQYRLMYPTWNTTVSVWQGVDDEPTAGSKNLVESSGVYETIQPIYGIKDYRLYRGNLDGNGTFQGVNSSNNYNFTIVKVNPGDVITLIRVSGSPTVRYSFFKTFTGQPQHGDHADLATGYSGVVSFGKITTDIIAPNDAYYFYIFVSLNEVSNLPKAVIINGDYNLINDIFTNIIDIKKDLQEEIETIKKAPCIYDISAANAVGGVLATYVNLSAAIAAIQQEAKKPGMSIKFICDNKYVQFRYIGTSVANADFINMINWQGVDEKPIEGSKNLAESGGIADAIDGIKDVILKSYNTEFENVMPVSSGDFSNVKTLIVADIPSGKEFTIHSSSEDNLFTQGTLYGFYDGGADSLSFRFALNKNFVFTASHHYKYFGLLASGGATDSGTLSTVVSYVTQNSNSQEERIENLENNTFDKEELGFFEEKQISGSANRYNPDALIPGKQINYYYGQITDKPNKGIYYLDVEPGDTVYFWALHKGSMLARYSEGIAVFDYDGNFIRGGGTGTNAHSYTVPNNVYKLCFNFSLSHLEEPWAIIMNDDAAPSKDDMEYYRGGKYYFGSKESLQFIDFNTLLPLAYKSTIEEKIFSIAHAGLSEYYPLDTELSIIGAKKAGFTAVEFNVQISSDGVYVLYHDDNMVRVGGTAQQTIGNLTYAELQTFDYGAWKDSKFTGTPICTFDNAIMVCKLLSLKVCIDCKTIRTVEQFTEANNIVKRWGMENDVYWLSGNFANTWAAIPDAKIIFPAGSKLTGSQWGGVDGWFTNITSNYPDKCVIKDGIYVFKDDVYFGVINNYRLMDDQSYGLAGLQLESEKAKKYNIKYGLYFPDDVEIIYNLCSSIPYMQYMESNSIAIQNALNKHYGISKADYLLSPNLLDD